MDEGGGHRAVDATRQGADHLAVAHPLADVRHGAVDQRGRGPRRAGAGNAQHEVAQDLAAAGGVRHLRVELDPVQVALGRGQAGVSG